MFEYTGKTIEVIYETGFHYKIEYLQDNKLRWTNLGKGAPGAPESAEETYYLYDQGNNQYMMNWVEEGGLVVSQVINFNKMTAFAFLSWDDSSYRGNRATLPQKGTLKFVE